MKNNKIMTKSLFYQTINMEVFITLILNLMILFLSLFIAQTVQISRTLQYVSVVYDKERKNTIHKIREPL